MLEASTQPNAVTAWWMQWPDANVAIRCGAGLLVLDIDRRNGGDETLAALEREHGPLPMSYRVITGNGFHVYFQTDPGARFRGTLGEGIDAKWDGYVMAPPSLHWSGLRYTVDLGSDEGPAPAPAWVIQLLQRELGTERAALPGTDARETLLGEAFSLAGMLGRHLGQGKWSVRCPWLLDHSPDAQGQRTGDGQDSSTALFPPTTAARVGGFCCRHSHCEGRGLQDVLRMLPVEAVAQAQARFPRMVAAPSSPADEPPWGDDDSPSPPPPEGEEGLSFVRGDHVELGAALVAVLKRSGPIVHCEGQMFGYLETGIFVPVFDEAQSRIVQGFAGALVGRKDPKYLKLKASDVAGALRLGGHAVADREFFATAPAGLAFGNGFVKVSAAAAVLEESSPAHRARHAYPFPYEHGKATPMWLKFLADIFRDDEDREERALLLHEFFGGALLGISTAYDQCLAMHGLGDDGKSTLLDILSAAMPSGSVASVPPHKLSGTGDSSDYFRAQLVGKLLNIVSELPEADLLESTGFKAMVSGDAVGARQPTKPAFTFRPKAAHAFAANRLPAVSDQSHGFWRRFLVMPFTRQFSKDPDRDPHIGQKIIAQELPGIVSALIDGGRRLLAAGKYTTPSTHGAALRAWQLRADAVRQFVEDCCDPCDVRDGAAAKALHGAYKRWAVEAGHKVLARNAFGERLALAGYPGKHFAEGSKYPLRLRQGAGHRDSVDDG
jgi:P4 family phage/plasmid primase-like protien